MLKKLALTALLSLAGLSLAAPSAQASGWIVIDPIVGGAVPPVVPRTTTTITPVRPGTATPRPGTMVLQGHVSFGLHLQSAQVKVEIKDQVAKTYITQTFENDTDRNLAGTYLFPLPDDTTFSSFSLHIDGKPVEGKILEANAARQQYEEIVRRMVDPGLLEFADYKTVRARIFPIPAHGTKKVELEYTQLLKAENGLLKYRYPLKSKVNDTPAEEIKVDVKLNSPQGLRTIWSPTHTITTTRGDNNSAKISMTQNDVVPDKDFYLYYSISNNEMAANLITHKAEGEDGYFLMSLTPPFKSKSVIGKDVVLVADTSGSMAGDKMDENKRALKYVVNALSANDRFGIVEFNTDSDSFKPTLLPATPENKKSALEYIDELTARGGTNIGEAISTAKTLLSGTDTRPAYMIFMTDGEPTVGEHNIDKLIGMANSKRDIRVFDFGVGYDVNTKLLNKLAEAHHGTAQYVEPEENLETALSAFYEKIKSPVLSDVKLAYTGIDVKNIYPREVKDIFAGSQVLLLGRYKKGGAATVALTGTVNGAAKNYSFPLNFNTTQAGNTHLTRLWAMRRIGYLTEVAQANGENKEVIDEIIALSKKHGIISQYTSYLVTDPSENGRLANNNLPGVIAMRQPMSSPRRRIASRGSAGFVPPPPPASPTWGMSSASPMAGDEGADFLLDSADRPVRKRQVASGGAYGGGGGGNSAVRGNLMGRMISEKSLDKSAFYKSRPQVQILDDERPIVKDFREAPQVGMKAVHLAKEVNKMKAESVLASESESAGRIQTVADKTFTLRSNNVWTDTSYSAKTSAKPKVIVFGSTEYFDLLKAQPELAKYLSVGKEVIVSFKGNTYKIVQSRNATG